MGVRMAAHVNDLETFKCINPPKRFIQLLIIRPAIFCCSTYPSQHSKYFSFLHPAGESSQGFWSFVCFVCWSRSSSCSFCCIAFLKVYIQVYIFADTSLCYVLKCCFHCPQNWCCCSWCKIIVGKCHPHRRYNRALLRFGDSIGICSTTCWYVKN